MRAAGAVSHRRHPRQRALGLVERHSALFYLESSPPPDGRQVLLDGRLRHGYLDKTSTERSAVLFADWKTWAEAAGEFVGSQKRFTQALENRGFVRGREGGTARAIIRGIPFRPNHGGQL